MGRQVRLHVLLVAQSATARALGGPEMRDQFATRLLARYTQNAWRILAPEITPHPRAPATCSTSSSRPCEATPGRPPQAEPTGPPGPELNHAAKQGYLSSHSGSRFCLYPA